MLNPVPMISPVPAKLSDPARVILGLLMGWWRRYRPYDINLGGLSERFVDDVLANLGEGEKYLIPGTEWFVLHYQDRWYSAEDPFGVDDIHDLEFVQRERDYGYRTFMEGVT